jgi:hypothetical protein
MKRFRVFIPEPEYPETLEMFKGFAEVVIGEPGVKYDEGKLARPWCTRLKLTRIASRSTRSA